MAGNQPFFVTGANAKIKVNGVTMALCTDVTYSIRVNHAAPHVLGVFEAFTQEPLTYSVSGSFTVIRYISGLKDFLGNSPDSVSDLGNGIGTWGPEAGVKQLVGSSGLDPQTRADQSMDPSKLHTPMAFDIEIQQKANGVSAIKQGERLNGQVATGILTLLRGCRITGSDFRLTKRGVAMQTFTFQACYADEDSFKASDSGVGQTTF
jgi:hypothetical protein